MFAVIGFGPDRKIRFALADGVEPDFEDRLKGQPGQNFNTLKTPHKNVDGLYHFDSERDRDDTHSICMKWFREQGFSYSIGGILKDDECENLFAFACWTHPPMSAFADLGTRLQTVMPHLERGFQITRRLEQRSFYCSALWNLLQDSPHGVIAVDNAMQILNANREASRIIAERDGLEQRAKKLVAGDSVVNSRLVALVRNPPGTYENDGYVRNQSVVIRRPSNRLPIVLMVLPHTNGRSEMACGPSMTFIFLRDLARELDSSIATFGMAFSLTPAERKLVGNLAAGQTLNEHSEVEGVSEETSRWHLKNVFAKTHCRSQIQLVNLARKSSMPRLKT
ncbi:MAG: hypothetical protein KDE55_02245 [Novosphingobium sp.]|nr:hypothetical protein [Novosphingobium sp.]